MVVILIDYTLHYFICEPYRRSLGQHAVKTDPSKELKTIGLQNAAGRGQH